MTEKSFDIFAIIATLALMIMFTVFSFTECLSVPLSLRIISCVVIDGTGILALLSILTDKK
jgi:hypothetical protein